MTTIGRDHPFPAPLDECDIEVLTHRFKQDLAAGGMPDMGLFVPQGSPQRVTILERLVGIDLEFRCQQGEAVSLAEYFERFPELALDGGCAIRLQGKVPLPIHGNAQFILADEEGCVSHGDSLELIQAICRKYLSDAQDGACQALDYYLAQISPRHQQVLLRNLLHLDIDRLRAVGQDPDIEGYVQALPDHSALIRQVFFDCATVSMALSDTSDRGCGPAIQCPADVAAAPYVGSYQLIRVLGRGGMGVVYEAVHLRTGERVALKTLPGVGGPGLHRFKREFRSVAEINHPNLIGLHSLESDGEHWFFTMDLIAGIDFLSFVRPSGILNIQRLRGSLSQLVAGVLALHSHKVIHRDLKPSNVLISNDGRVTVLDFGLVAVQKTTEHSSLSEISGTPAYMAPEQGLGHTVSGAADWYSVGVMLYQALVGKLPYPPCSPIELLHRKTVVDAESIPDAIGAPEDLATLAMGLLARTPDERPDPFDIVKTLSGPRVTGSPGASTASAVLVGRDQQLRQLKSALESVRTTNQAFAVFVSGKSGEGKTCLIEQFLQTTSNTPNEPVTLTGRCYDRESVPFKALDSLVDALTAYLKKLPDAVAALLMPDDIAFLSKLFPVMQRVPVVAKLVKKDISDLDQQQVRSRAFNALRSLLHRTTQQTPVVLAADDLQWGDSDSAEAFFEMLRPPHAPAVLFIGSFRSDEADASPFLTTWKDLNSGQNAVPQVTATVAPLTLDECTQLTLRIVGQDTETVRRRAFEFHQETGGNAYFFTELAGCFDPASDSFRAVPIHEVIDGKLARLPPEARGLLDAIAVSGQALLASEAGRTMQCASAVMSLLTHMRSEKLVRLMGNEEDIRVDTYHDRVRESVLDHMQVERRRSLHNSLAEVIEAATPSLTEEEIAAIRSGADGEVLHDVPRVFDLAYHFDAAGDRDKACAYAIVAASKAARQFSQQSAAEKFAVARRNLPPDNSRLRCLVAIGEARALSLLGSYDAAADSLLGQELSAVSAYERARIIGLQAEICHKQGKIQDGIELYARALRTLGYRVPASALGLICGLGREVVVQFLHSVSPKSFYQKQIPPTECDALAIELANRNSIVNYYNNTVRMLWTHLKGLNLAETRLPSAGLAYSYGLHPAPTSAIGMAARGLRFSNIALAMAEASGDLLTQGHCYAMRSMAYYTSGKYSDSVRTALKSIALASEAGDPYVIFVAGTQLSFSSTRLTENEQAAEYAFLHFERAIRSGETASAGGLLLALALATNGDFPFRELRTCFGLSNHDHFSHAVVGLAEGVWLANHERWERAAEVLAEAWARAWKNAVIIPYTVAILAWLATVQRRHAESLPGSSEERSRLLSKAWKSARVAAWMTRLYVSERAHALREYGLLLCHRKKTEAGRKQLRQSIALAEQHGDVWQAALSSMEYGKLELRLGIDTGTERVANAQSTISRVASSISRLDGEFLRLTQTIVRRAPENHVQRA